MELEIDRKIQRETLHCKKAFCCLKDNMQGVCHVESFVEKKLLFVKCAANSYCSYKMAFGFDSKICTCPIRKEIFSKYEK